MYPSSSRRNLPNPWPAARRLALVAALAGCSAGQPSPPDPPPPPEASSPAPSAQALEGTRWELTELRGVAVDAAQGTRPTLEFFAGGRASGNTGCNSMSGSYEASGESLRLGPMATTRRACPDQDPSREQTYLRALEATTRYAVAGGRLTLYAGSEAVARFRPAAGRGG